MELIHCELCDKMFMVKIPLDCDSYMCNRCAKPFARLVGYLDSREGQKRLIGLVGIQRKANEVGGG